MLDLKGYEGALLQGAWVTLQVALLSVLLAMLLGMLGALAKLSRNRPARALATGYTTLVRGIPDLVLMMLIFFGGQVLLNVVCTGINESLNEWLAQDNPAHEWTRITSYNVCYTKLLRFVVIEGGRGKHIQILEAAALQQLGDGTLEGDLEARVGAEGGKAGAVAWVEQYHADDRELAIQ